MKRIWEVEFAWHDGMPMRRTFLVSAASFADAVEKGHAIFEKRYVKSRFRPKHRGPFPSFGIERVELKGTLDG